MLEEDGGNVSSPVEVVNNLGEEFARYSSGASYSSPFQTPRASLEPSSLPFSVKGDGDAKYNDTITGQELHASLSPGRDGAAGPDSIPYALLRRLHHSGKDILLDLFLRIWSSRSFPPIA